MSQDMDTYGASNCQYAPLRERADLFEFNITVTVRLFGDLCVCMCPTRKVSGAGDAEALPMVGRWSAQPGQLDTWLDAGRNIIDNTEDDTGLFL